MGIKLIKPTIEYAEDIMEYRNEFLQCGDSMDGCGSLRECKTAKEWLMDNELSENSKTVPSYKVPSTAYIAVREGDNKIVGIANFRHHINHPVLSVWGGHIGYSVRPSERRNGYAKMMLKEVLKECKKSGLYKVLITCDRDNQGSKKTIMANGGVFDKEVEIDGKIIERYFITLS